MMEFIQKLISDRWIKVRVGGSTSQNKQTDMGSSHGGVLCVTIFLVTINGILREQGNWVNESLFTDDLVIYFTTRNQRVVARTLQRVTSKLDVWTAEELLTFSTSKTINIVFRKRRRRIKEPMKITLKTKVIPYKESTQFLRLTLNSRLNCEERVDRVRAKAKKKH